MHRYVVFKQRLERGACSLSKISDADNASDFLSKWVPKQKLNQSLDYCTNRNERVTPTDLPSTLSKT